MTGYCSMKNESRARISIQLILRQAGFNRANLGAIAAIGAQIRIYDIKRIAQRYGIFGTLGHAGITHDTFIGNYISHSENLPLLTASGIRI
jgi:hypothetical protein